MAEPSLRLYTTWDGGSFRARGSPIPASLGHGEGLFETLRVAGSVPLFVTGHLSRLCRSAAALGLARPSRDALRLVGAEAARLARRGGLADGRCRVLWAPPVLEVSLERMEIGIADSSVSLFTAPWRRDGSSPIHRHKTIACLENRLALAEAVARGGFDALFVDPSNNVLEGARTNVFAVIGNAIVTPPVDEPILPGTARARLVRLLRAAGVRVHETRVSGEDLRAGQEMFVTNALRGVVPVGRLDGRRIGRAAPGPLTRLAGEIFERAAQAEAARASRSILRRQDRSS